MAEAADVDAVRRLLGREPLAEFEVVVRSPAGEPVVIQNAPVLPDGTPMPTRYWLVGPDERVAVSRLESEGLVDVAEAAVDAVELAACHERAAAERTSALPPGWTGLTASGGVGGTRVGVKCLHAHFANHLAGNDDPVGRWVASALAERAASTA